MCPSNPANPAVRSPAPAPRRRPRRDLRCPRHPDQILRSVSPKRYLAESAGGELRCGPVQRERFLLWAERHRLSPLPDDWIEAFHCPACDAVVYWRLTRTSVPESPSESSSESRRESRCEPRLRPVPEGVLAQLRLQNPEH